MNRCALWDSNPLPRVRREWNQIFCRKCDNQQYLLIGLIRVARVTAKSKCKWLIKKMESYVSHQVYRLLIWRMFWTSTMRRGYCARVTHRMTWAHLSERRGFQCRTLEGRCEALVQCLCTFLISRWPMEPKCSVGRWTLYNKSAGYGCCERWHL